ncbi:MAG: polysaccharide pyruvyl transferase family protein, partial [Clostridia bacterium]|nr:polysaccharide pyruvyl transferase family protein [Clostridia bacterium]
EAYVYVYLMGNNDAACRFAEKLAAQKKLRIVFHTNHSGISFDGEPSLSDGPLEFLWRIKNASCIVTDTFHGTAFSIIFHKQFITFTRGNMSVRLEDFLSHIGLKERFVEYVEDTDRIDEPIDYEVIDSRIGEWVSASREWFRNALDLSLNNTTGGSFK